MRRTTESLAGLARWLVALVRQPAFWLALQMLVVWLMSAADPGLEPHRVPDTAAYISAARSTSTAGALSSHRTYGYPLFLKMFSDSSGRIHLGRVPAMQKLAFFASVFFFWWAFSRFSGGPWLAFAAATALLHSPISDLAKRIQPDILAGAFVIAAISSLMLLAVRRAAIWWIVLAITLFYSYQLRPSGVFLIGLVPLLGCVYQVVRNGQLWREGLTFAGLLALVCLVPYLTFATVRWATVGHFGLVTWGKNVSGAMAMCFLDGKLITELPEPHQRLARKLHRARRDAGFEPMRRSDDPLLWYQQQFDDNLFRISPSVVRRYLKWEALQSIDDPPRRRSSEYEGIEIGHRLGALAKEIVRRRPWLHKRWVRGALNHGLARLDDAASIMLPFALLIPSMALALVIGTARHRDPAAPRAPAMLCLTITAFTFFSIYLLLASAISFPFGRYMASIVLFVPPLLMALLFETWRHLLAPFREQFTRPSQ